MTNTILAKLEATLGTVEFNSVFQALKAMKATEVSAIASKFVSAGGKSLSKKENLQRIHDRHANLIDSAQKLAYLRRS